VVGVHPCRPSSYGRQGRASNSLKKKRKAYTLASRSFVYVLLIVLHL
jgi:hypothetical protein